MSMSTGPAKVALVEFDGRAVRADAFEDRLAMVLGVIDNGAIAREKISYYGSDAHLAALQEIEKQIVVVRRKISESRERGRIAEAEEAIGDADLDDGC